MLATALLDGDGANPLVASIGPTDARSASVAVGVVEACHTTPVVVANKAGRAFNAEFARNSDGALDVTTEAAEQKERQGSKQAKPLELCPHVTTPLGTGDRARG